MSPYITYKLMERKFPYFILSTLTLRVDSKRSGKGKEGRTSIYKKWVIVRRYFISIRQKIFNKVILLSQYEINDP